MQGFSYILILVQVVFWNQKCTQPVLQMDTLWFTFFIIIQSIYQNINSKMHTIWFTNITLRDTYNKNSQMIQIAQCAFMHHFTSVNLSLWEKSVRWILRLPWCSRWTSITIGWWIWQSNLQFWLTDSGVFTFSQSFGYQYFFILHWSPYPKIHCGPNRRFFFQQHGWRSGRWSGRGVQFYR